MSINRVTISGNLTRDPELRTTQSGTSILAFGMAVNDRRRNPQSGEWEDYANFVDCAVFGRRAEALSDLLHKGEKVAVEGRLRWRQWQAQDGSNRSKLEVVVDELELMSQRAQQPPRGQGQVVGYQPAYPQQAASPVQVPRPSAPRPQQAGPAPGPAPQAAQGQLRGMPQPQPTTYDQYYDEDIPF